MGIPLKKVAKRWMKEPGFKEGYDALEDEFALNTLWQVPHPYVSTLPVPVVGKKR